MYNLSEKEIIAFRIYQEVKDKKIDNGSYLVRCQSVTDF
jgi:hypothetical protein